MSSLRLQCRLASISNLDRGSGSPSFPAPSLTYFYSDGHRKVIALIVSATLPCAIYRCSHRSISRSFGARYLITAVVYEWRAGFINVERITIHGKISFFFPSMNCYIRVAERGYMSSRLDEYVQLRIWVNGGRRLCNTVGSIYDILCPITASLRVS
jgi:hypothetical protein